MPPEILEPRLVGLEKDVEHLKAQTVMKNDVLEMLAPMREELLLQGVAIKDLAANVSKMATSNLKTDERVQGILESYEKTLLADAQRWSISNVFKNVVIAAAGLTSLGGFTVGVYAALKFFFQK